MCARELYLLYLTVPEHAEYSEVQSGTVHTLIIGRAFFR
jgi:hypothetical protein